MASRNANIYSVLLSFVPFFLDRALGMSGIPSYTLLALGSVLLLFGGGGLAWEWLHRVGQIPQDSLQLTPVRSRTPGGRAKLLLEVVNSGDVSVELTANGRPTCEGCPSHYQAVWEESTGGSIRLAARGGKGHLIVAGIRVRKRLAMPLHEARVYLWVGQMSQAGPQHGFIADEWRAHPKPDGAYEREPTPVVLELELVSDPRLASPIRRRFRITGKPEADFDWEELPYATFRRQALRLP